MQDNKMTLRYILSDKLPEYLKRFGKSARVTAVIGIIHVMLQCGLYEKGYMSYFCRNCKSVKRIKFSCKTRLCGKCGEVLTQKFAIEFTNRMLNVTHRHIMMSIPAALWPYYDKNVKLRHDLVKRAYSSLKEMMELYTGRKIKPGCMAVLHTSGRDLKSNYHVHLLITEGGVDENNNWVRFTYFPYEKRGKITRTINEIWRDSVIESLRSNLRRDITVYNLLMELPEKYPNGFYVYGPSKNRIKSNRMAKKKAKYITKYVKHPIISDARIESYDGEKVTFWYDYPTTNERKYVKMDVLVFINSILMHIPPKNFRLVTYYGLYSPNHPQKEVIQCIFDVDGRMRNPNELDWRDNSYLTYGRDPLICPKCGEEMILVCLVIKRTDRYRVYYKLDVDDLAAIGYDEKEPIDIIAQQCLIGSNTT